MDAGELRGVWEEFWQTRDSRARERLILEYLPLAKRAEAAVRRRLPQADVDDVGSWANLGLIRAVDRWDPEYGSTFESYALGSIMGVAIDGARSIDWAPRSVRRKQRNVDRAVESLEDSLGRAPSAEEVAEELEWDLRDVAEAFRATEAAFVKSLDEERNIDVEGESVSRYEQVEDDKFPDPAQRMLVSDAISRAMAHLRTMPMEVRLLVALYYFEGFRLADVGAVLGITESRAGMRHSEAVVGLCLALESAVS